MSHVPFLAIHLDDSLPKVAADLALALFIVVNAMLGFKRGLVRRIVGAIGMFLGALAATYTGNAVAALIGSRDVSTNAWCFIAVYLVVIIMFEIIGALYHERLQKMVMVTFDKTTGIIAGAVLGFLEASIIFIVALAVSAAPATASTNGSTISADSVKNSTLTEVIVPLQSGIKALFGPVLPSDICQHLLNGTSAITNNNATNNSLTATSAPAAGCTAQ